jgi:hypothetical protein
MKMSADEVHEIQLDFSELAGRIAKASSRDRKFYTSCSEGEVTPLELFGMRVGSMRRSRNLGLEELSTKAHMDTELLLAIELGQAPLDEISKNIRVLGDALGDEYLNLSRLLTHLLLP